MGDSDQPELRLKALPLPSFNPLDGVWVIPTSGPPSKPPRPTRFQSPRRGMGDSDNFSDRSFLAIPLEFQSPRRGMGDSDAVNHLREFPEIAMFQSPRRGMGDSDESPTLHSRNGIHVSIP